jgi:hypothetical protein
MVVVNGGKGRYWPPKLVMIRASIAIEQVEGRSFGEEGVVTASCGVQDFIQSHMERGWSLNYELSIWTWEISVTLSSKE